MSLNFQVKENISLKCAFYDKCALPKQDFLCDKFPDYLICPEFQLKKDKLLKV